MSTLSQLEASIGYTFKSAALFKQALTHRSFSEDNNERLEFLGDSILSYVVAAALYDQFPDLTEGDLSRLRARLVKQQTLAAVARELSLGTYLIMGAGEMMSGGSDRDSILSDALEALIGAVFLDDGIESVSACILLVLRSRLDQLDASDLEKDPKTRLQEHLQGKGAPLPEYKLVSTRGKSPHQEFEIACQSATFDSSFTAKGSSRRKAEQAAASLALTTLGLES